MEVLTYIRNIRAATRRGRRYIHHAKVFQVAYEGAGGSAWSWSADIRGKWNANYQPERQRETPEHPLKGHYGSDQ